MIPHFRMPSFPLFYFFYLFTFHFSPSPNSLSGGFYLGLFHTDTQTHTVNDGRILIIMATSRVTGGRTSFDRAQLDNKIKIYLTRTPAKERESRDRVQGGDAAWEASAASATRSLWTWYFSWKRTSKQLAFDQRKTWYCGLKLSHHRLEPTPGLDMLSSWASDLTVVFQRLLKIRKTSCWIYRRYKSSILLLSTRHFNRE